MALTPLLKPDGFQPIGGSSDLIYTFNESSIAGHDNYRVEIEFNGLSGLTETFSFRPDSSLNISCNIAPMLRTQLALDPDPALRLLSTYVKYQAVWDGGSDAQVPLSANVIYFYVGDNNILNKRSQLEITTTAGEFLLRSSKLYAWAGRTTYIDFLNGLGVNWVLSSGSSESHFGTSSKKLESIPITFTDDATVSLNALTWTLGASAANTSWFGLCFGAALYVAVAGSGTTSCVMTSPTGATWTLRTGAAANNWKAVCYNGTNLFVAVSDDGTGNRVMTSPNGITWTSRTSAADNNWQAVCFGNGLFVAVSNTGTGNRVMTSPDGITWTSRTSASDNDWYGVTYGNGLFVAVAGSGTATRVMTSPDGITWTTRTSASDKVWRSIAYSSQLGLFAAVASDANANSVMTSPDGITWTLITTPDATGWRSIVWGNGLFLAVTSNGTSNVLASYDGITWVLIAAAANRQWNAVAFSGTNFASIGFSGTGDRAFYSGAGTLYAQLTEQLQDECANPIYLKWINDYGGLTCRLFDFNQIFNIVPDTGGRYKKMVIFIQSKSQAIWLDVEELNRYGAEYGDNQKLGAYVVDFTDEDDVINVFIEPSPASTLTKYRGNNAQLLVRYPIINNSDIS